MKRISSQMRALVVIVLIGAASVPARAQTLPNPCNDSTDALLGMLRGWIARDHPDLGSDYCVFASGAALAVMYNAGTGFDVPLSQRLLWPGNLFALADSAYVPLRPATFQEARELLLEYAAGGRPVLALSETPLQIYGVDSSLGEPWFFLARCLGSDLDSTIWDAADLRRQWWRWTDLPGVNTLWPLAPQAAPVLGRRSIRGGMRNLVLAARPDTVAGHALGLAAFQSALEHLDLPPGSTERLAMMSRFRQQAGDYLTGAADLWAPGDREPVKLAAFYLQKDSEAWQTLTAVSGAWLTYGVDQRREWIAAMLDWETRAAVALDEIVSAAE